MELLCFDVILNENDESDLIDDAASATNWVEFYSLAF